MHYVEKIFMKRNFNTVSITNGNSIQNNPGKQLKETVEKAIANTTQQLLQFIKLEKQLKGSKEGMAMSGSKNDIDYMNSLTNVVNTIRNSNTVDSKVDSNSQHLSGINDIKSTQNPQSGNDKQVKLRKSNEKEDSNAFPNSSVDNKQGSSTSQEQSAKDDKPEQKYHQQTKTYKSEQKQKQQRKQLNLRK